MNACDKVEWHYAHPHVNFALREVAMYQRIFGRPHAPFFYTGLPKQAWPGMCWSEWSRPSANDAELQPCA